MTPTHLVSTNYTDYSATFLIAGVRWEYFFPGPIGLHNLEIIYKKSALKALNYAKKNSIRARKVEAAA